MLKTLTVNGKSYHYYSLRKFGDGLEKLPYSIRLLLESVLRNCDGELITEQDVSKLAAWRHDANVPFEIPFMPARVLLQDFTGVPAVVDLAAMRSAMYRLGGNPNLINPLIPVDLVIDHSVQTDFYGSRDALAKNIALEFERNKERYSLLNWAQNSLNNFRVVPPSVGIIHQVNIEFLADVVHLKPYKKNAPQESSATFCNKKSEVCCGDVNDDVNGDHVVGLLYPDSVLGTDSHTVMVNCLGVVGWGVGGIEAEAVMLGQPYYMLSPQVIGFELTGKLRRGVTATDLVLTITEFLRRNGVVGKFIEYYGSGVSTMPVTDRALIANMAPEYGATMGFFPVDELTLDYLRQTGRSEEQISVVEKYCKEQLLYREDSRQELNYTSTLSLDLSDVDPSLAGPKRPQDRVAVSNMKSKFQRSLSAAIKDRGFGLDELSLQKSVKTEAGEIRHGSVVIASITSCTNTSNPQLMMAAGLLARNAVERGLTVSKFVKTSLAPGSRVVTDYLIKSGLYGALEELGFHVVGYGCMSCIGNSGSILPEVERVIFENGIVAAAVLSGNRNFEGRINPAVKANYLASPPMVVAYALAGNVLIDFEREPIGCGTNGEPVFLRDIFPDDGEVAEFVEKSISPTMYNYCYENVFCDSNIKASARVNNDAAAKICDAIELANASWNGVSAGVVGLSDAGNSDVVKNKNLQESNLSNSAVTSAAVLGDVSRNVSSNTSSNTSSNASNNKRRLNLFRWDTNSTYIQEPPFLFDMRMTQPDYVSEIFRARVLVLLGDSVTTDHISPAGSIKVDSPAGSFLSESGVGVSEFNSYGSRRGNDKVMVRGTFANIRLQNMLVEGLEGGVTKFFPDGEVMSIYDAAMRYKSQGVPLIILAGGEYGTGSSRDWAAKGTALLGVRGVIAAGFERIHRGNLIGMGILPLEFPPNVTWQKLGLTGCEEFTIPEIDKDSEPGSMILVTAEREVQPNMISEIQFQVKLRIDTPIELKYYLNGGIMQTVIRKMLKTES
ncbi:MAG: aconitate hydratase [Planctomycetaceae bacterium]|jgi:aconitase A|nr:aconitate hydratase [Planctomycetaceae bacterium]